MYDIFRSRVIFLVPLFCWKAEGDVSLDFGAGVAGLGFVLPRGPGSGEGAVAHKGSPRLLSGVELGGWSRGAWLLAPWARSRRRLVGGVGGRGASATWAPGLGVRAGMIIPSPSVVVVGSTQRWSLGLWLLS